MKLLLGDCLKRMDRLIAQGVHVDAIITDPPYGTTACKWDTIIPFDDMWERLNKLIKSNGAIVLFGSEPFSSALRMSNIKNYKYDWVWEKDKPTNFALSNKQPMRYSELISVFYFEQPVFNKIMEAREGDGKKRYKYIVDNSNRVSEHCNIKDVPKYYDQNYKNPKNIQKFSTGRRQNLVHPTQKPVALMEYFIKTYTNESETVLDFTMGSGTTGVACINTNRNFIGIELDKGYFEISKKRIRKAEEHKRNILI